ncbi:hypothetical protein LXL04_032997 [Taraxacum kok-saghyz]
MAIDDFCRADGGVVDERLKCDLCSDFMVTFFLEKTMFFCICMLLQVITTVDATIIRRMELEALESKPTLSRKLVYSMHPLLLPALIEKISPFMEIAQPMLHDLTLTV